MGSGSSPSCVLVASVLREHSEQEASGGAERAVAARLAAAPGSVMTQGPFSPPAPEATKPGCPGAAVSGTTEQLLLLSFH